MCGYVELSPVQSDGLLVEVFVDRVVVTANASATPEQIVGAVRAAGVSNVSLVRGQMVISAGKPVQIRLRDAAPGPTPAEVWRKAHAAYEEAREQSPLPGETQGEVLDRLLPLLRAEQRAMEDLGVGRLSPVSEVVKQPGSDSSTMVFLGARYKKGMK